jgi:hypothetical protein
MQLPQKVHLNLAMAIPSKTTQTQKNFAHKKGINHAECYVVAQ